MPLTYIPMYSCLLNLTLPNTANHISYNHRWAGEKKNVNSFGTQYPDVYHAQKGSFVIQNEDCFTIVKKMQIYS